MSGETTATANGQQLGSRRAAPAQADRPSLRSVDQLATEVTYPPIATRWRSSRLSGRERLILAELARGLSTEEIAVTLVLSPHTVRTHIKNALRRLEAKTRAHAVAIALSEAAIELQPSSRP